MTRELEMREACAREIERVAVDLLSKSVDRGGFQQQLATLNVDLFNRLASRIRTVALPNAVGVSAAPEATRGGMTTDTEQLNDTKRLDHLQATAWHNDYTEYNRLIGKELNFRGNIGETLRQAIDADIATVVEVEADLSPAARASASPSRPAGGTA